MRLVSLVLLATACRVASSDTVDTDSDSDAAAETDIAEGTWNPRLPEAGTAIAPLRGRIHQRAVFHLHSPWSHDACDNRAAVGGDEDTVSDIPACLADLRAGLCATRFDVAFVTDHPAYGDAHTWEQMFHPQPGDELVRDGDDILENLITCDDGHVLHYRAGFEDELMPVGLHRHVDPDQPTRDALLNGTGTDSMDAMIAAKGWVFQAHTEGKALEDLTARQDAGLHSVEAFNVHAMFAPNIRKDDLGLDPIAWTADIGPFTSTDEGHAEPDLFFLAVLQEQLPSVTKWDALLQRGPMMATAGTDAHQNVFNYQAADGERVDSYRRMLRWFSMMLITDDASRGAVDAAIAARRAFVAFEALGTPTGFDFHLEADGQVYEMGSDAPAGTLVVTCPTLAPGSPHGADAPEVAVTVYKDGEIWQTACGTFEAGPGVYRVKVEQTPWHLREFLGNAPTEKFLKAYPWIYSGAIRVGMD